jgi:hypothetical protein
MSHTVTAVCLNVGGTVREFPLSSTFSVDNFDIEQIPLACRKYIGTNDISRECDYSYLGNKVSVFAYTKGRTLNKHELPPPIDEECYYGNIFVICHNSEGELVDFTEEDYESFYASSFGGFEDIEDEDSERSEEDDDDDGEDLKDFIVDDDADEGEDDDYTDDGHSDDDEDSEDDEVTEEDIQEWYEELETLQVYIETMREKKRDIKPSILEKYESIKENLRAYDPNYRD